MGKTITLISLFICWSFILQANDFKDLKFKYLTVDDGLSNNRIRCVYRDSKDFVWIGTNSGLNRYDGENIKVFVNSVTDSSTLSHSDINCILEDNNGLLWIGSINGLNTFDRKTEKFQRYINNPQNSNSIPNNSITDIIKDKFGNIWITTKDGFCKYDIASGKFKQFRFPVTENATLHNFIYNLSYDGKERIWFGSMGDVLWSFDITNEKFNSYNHPIIQSTLNMEKRVAVDKNRIWIGTVGAGLLCYNITSGECEKFPVSNDNRGTSGQDIKSIKTDNGKYLYIGVDQGGINRLDLEKLTFDYCTKNDFREQSLNNNGIWTVYIDKEGIMYVGTSSGGLNIYNPKEHQFDRYKHNIYNNNSLIYNVVYCFFEDSQGLIWIGTDGGGLSVFDPKTKTFKNYVHNPKDKNSISGNAVLCIGEDKNHDMWLGTWGAGLNKFDRKTGKFTRFYPEKDNPSSLSSINVWDMVFDQQGQLWMTYFYQHGVDVFDINKGVVKRHRHVDGDPTSLQSNNVVGIKKVGNQLGFLTSAGYCTYNPATKKFKSWEALNLMSLEDVLLDSKGNYWFSSNKNGLIKLTNKGDIERYGKNAGFKSERVIGVLEDSKGYIWISSYAGLSKYDPNKDEFTHNYLSTEPNDKQSAIISSLRASDGTVYLGGFNGFYSFRPEDHVENNYVPNVVINEFQIFNQTIVPDVSTPFLKNVIMETNEIKLSYKEDVFSFGFQALNYTYPWKSKYKYMLEGYDNDWIETTDNRKFITYTNLNPDTYILKIKASNNDNVWNESPTTIKIIISPPLWERWWFKLLAILAVIGSVLYYYYRRVSRLKKQKRILEETVNERTAKLLEVNQELEQSQEEIVSQNEEIQKQNRELEMAIQTKNKLFSIIAHDLKNPFNSIMGFANILYDDYEKLNDEEKKNFLLIIKDSSERTFQLIENLLDWARTQNNRIAIEQQDIKVVDLIHRNVQLLKSNADKKNLTIRYGTIDPLFTIFADINMTDTVIRNLLTNAIKFSPEGSNIEIKSFSVNGEIAISIIDEGVGMSNEKINNLFNLNLKQTTQGTSGEKGTGLGLIVCKEFVERNNGSIEVKSELNKGTEFIVRFPSV